MTRHIKRGGKVWINIFPDKPVTQKPAETRMGSGKGNPERWVAVVKPGPDPVRAVATPTTSIAKAALERAIQKLPIKARFVTPRGGVLMAKAAQVRDLGDAELVEQLAEAKQELFNLRFQHATGQLDERHGAAGTRRSEVARLIHRAAGP